MRSARIAAAGVLCLVLSACGMFEKRKEHTETQRRPPPHLAAQSGTPVTSPAPEPKQLSGGSTMSIISGDNGNQVEYRPAR